MARSIKVYPLNTANVAAAGVATPQIPVNPSRISLFIQNTGANGGYVRFGSPNQGQGFDVTVVPLGSFKWDQADTCPTEALYFTGNTSWCVMEGNP